MSDDVNAGPSRRRETGIPGLDRILDGGLPVAGVYIVQGPPGAGKTILANQMCFHYARTGGRAVYVTLLAESYSRMFEHLREMQFFDESAIPDKVYYIGGFRTLAAEGLEALVALVRGAIQKNAATLLVIDGLVSAQESASSDREFKKFIHEIQILAELTQCSVLLLTNAERAGGFFPEHTMVDGVLHLTDELSELRPLRHIRILKLRGGAPVRGLHSMRISERGIEVRPRIETLLPEQLIDDDLAARGTKMALGVGGLDVMLRGGVRTGSVTMLLGPSGSGKTILGMHFLSEGIRNGERVLYFGFYERPAAILAKCQRVGLGGIRDGVDRGLARIVWHRPVEGVVDELGQSLVEAVREMKAQRVFIDGMQGFERATDFPERLSHVYSAISHELQRLGATTLYTTETRELFGRDIEVPITGLSAVTQNIILLRHVEHRATMSRVLTILKIRDDDYDGGMRELRITDAGIVLTDRFTTESHLVTGGGDPGVDAPINAVE